ncbi:hypothetical protein DRF65_06665 [Chryseobacterium pennae]|uniref:DUF6705 domain-containing protein n=1 Tax=Chryseobacterium pennae TaxID=2258962 RepID=A0A3D9CC72_9FLAO|nr:DUF6705 family protein [Chryseobacterium pennae]REC63328.1 hypothetical protein DRF65_06665 [Chryseobacterium pennae]
MELKFFLKKQVYIFLVLCLGLISCKAQQVLPLNTSDYSSPTNSYFKDLDNELSPYIGTWKSIFQNKTIILNITKEIKRPYSEWGKSFFSDVLIVKYEIKDSNGNILQTTLNNTYHPNAAIKNLILSLGTKADGQIDLLYAGGNCSVGIGDIIFKKLSSTQFSWNYYPGTTTRNDITCPPDKDYTIYLPETENLIFTKQ